MKAGHECFIFDILQIHSGVMQQLQAILEDPAMVKVMHDCRQDSAALWYQKSIRICNIFDTQVSGVLACWKDDNYSSIMLALNTLPCSSQVADALVGLWEGVLDGQQDCKPAIGLQSLLSKHQLPLSASKPGDTC